MGIDTKADAPCMVSLSVSVPAVSQVRTAASSPLKRWVAHQLSRLDTAATY